MRALLLLTAVLLSACGGGPADAPAPAPAQAVACKPTPVPITELRKTCHAVGTDECAYVTIDSYTFVAVNLCKEG